MQDRQKPEPLLRELGKQGSFAQLRGRSFYRDHRIITSELSVAGLTLGDWVAGELIGRHFLNPVYVPFNILGYHDGVTSVTQDITAICGAVAIPSLVNSIYRRWPQR